MSFFKKNGIEKNEFLSLFSVDSPKTVSTMKVDIHGRIVPLKTYIQEKNITKEDVKNVVNAVSQKNEYLERFYKTSLQLPETLKIDDPPMTVNHIHNNEIVRYKNVIRNLHFREILQQTKSGLENQKSFLVMILDFYTRGLIDYKILTPSARFYIAQGRLGSVFSSYSFRASIMNPYLVYSVNHSLLKGTRVFTPTLGWTSYCYGFMECPMIREYVGTDVIPSVCKKTAEFAKTFYPEKTATIYCSPSEKLIENPNFMKKYQNYFDVVFFSPPYYRLELYAGKNQSTNQYKTYEEWLHQYWEKTIQLCYWVLQPGGKCCYILSGYGSQRTQEHYDLLKDMNTIAKKYFHLKTIKPMHNKNVYVTGENHRETAEKIMVFEKNA